MNRRELIRALPFTVAAAVLPARPVPTAARLLCRIPGWWSFRHLTELCEALSKAGIEYVAVVDDSIDQAFFSWSDGSDVWIKN